MLEWVKRLFSVSAEEKAATAARLSREAERAYRKGYPDQDNILAAEARALNPQPMPPKLPPSPDPEIERLAQKIEELKKGSERGRIRHQINDLERRVRAIRSFDSHEIRHRGERHFTIMKRYRDGSEWDGKWDSNMGAEIFVGFWGTLYVGGDIGPVVYAYYGSDGVRGCLAWIGGCNDVSYYVAQKASIGTRSGKGLTTWSLDEMILDLKDHLDTYEDCYGEEPPEELKEAIAEFLSFPAESQDLAINHFYEELGYDDTEPIFNMGETLDSDVYFTWAAVRRLHLLLKAEDES